MAGAKTAQIPLVSYLALEPEPHLVATACKSCGAKFFDRRNACASCEGTDFSPVSIPTTGELKAYTIVSMAAPGIPVPFVAGVIDCEGTSVRGNIINTEPDPDHVQLGMKVKLATYTIGTDDNGTEAVGFGFEPI
jgi:uncharacterized protein